MCTNLVEGSLTGSAMQVAAGEEVTSQVNYDVTGQVWHHKGVSRGPSRDTCTDLVEGILTGRAMQVAAGEEVTSQVNCDVTGQV